MEVGTDAGTLEELRRSDFARLDAGGHVYLDYTGAGLYADSQLGEHLDAAAATASSAIRTRSTRPRRR